MIDARGIEEIIGTYRKHGWILRRVLLTSELDQELNKDKNELFGEAEIIDSAIDAAWFSRPPKAGGVAWEIRYFGDIPYALLEQADENSPDFENFLRDMEERLHETIAKKETA